MNERIRVSRLDESDAYSGRGQQITRCLRSNTRLALKCLCVVCTTRLQHRALWAVRIAVFSQTRSREPGQMAAPFFSTVLQRKKSQAFYRLPHQARPRFRNR